MSHHRLPSLIALVMFSISMFCSAEGKPFGPGEAAGRSKASQRADFKVVVWYRHSDPLGTFKFEIYDVRKGEYTAKVDEWMKDVRVRFPAFYVVVRSVDLTREKGKTDLLKVGAVIDRELVVAASRAGIVIGQGGSEARPMGFGVFGLAPGASPNRGSQLSPLSGRDRDYLRPSPTPFPVPVPFPHLPR